MGDWGFESIFHFTVNATNFERSLAFYQTLGFQLLRDNRDVVWPAFVAFAVFSAVSARPLRAP